jgi:hypothetical protein
MRASLMLLLCAGALGCGDTTSGGDMAVVMQDLAMKIDSATAQPTLTVNNTLSWCTVTVTIGSGSPTMFTDASRTFMAASGTTVNLQADPLPGFFAVKWTGTTTMNGDKATYVMSSSATQAVTACCPTSAAGSGC